MNAQVKFTIRRVGYSLKGDNGICAEQKGMYATLIFGTFLGIFILTALASLADLVGIIKLKDESARVWLRRGLLTEVIGVILAMASMLLVNRNAEVWTIFGKITLNQVVENSSPQQAVISIAPPTVEIDELGWFEADIVVRKKNDGSWDYPKIQISVPGYASQTIHFDDIWNGFGDENLPSFKKDEDKHQIIITTPIVLEIIKQPYMPSGILLNQIDKSELPNIGDPL